MTDRHESGSWPACMGFPLHSDASMARRFDARRENRLEATFDGRRESRALASCACLAGPGADSSGDAAWP